MNTTNADTQNIHTASPGTNDTDKDTDTWVEVVKRRGKKRNNECQKGVSRFECTFSKQSRLNRIEITLMTSLFFLNIHLASSLVSDKFKLSYDERTVFCNIVLRKGDFLTDQLDRNAVSATLCF